MNGGGPQPGMHAQPSPITVAVGMASTPGGSMVVQQVESVTGSSLFFLDPDTAEQVGSEMVRMARQARTGLVVPGPGI